jgi:hypothetical protein
MPAKPRFSPQEELQLGRRIASAAVGAARAGGLDEDADVLHVRTYRVGRLRIVYTTPAGRAAGGRVACSVDIWTNAGRVFSALWKPFELLAFDYDDWVYELVSDAPSPRIGKA